MLGCDPDDLPTLDQRLFNIASMFVVWRSVDNFAHPDLTGMDRDGGNVMIECNMVKLFDIDEHLTLTSLRTYSFSRIALIIVLRTVG